MKILVTTYLLFTPILMQVINGGNAGLVSMISFAGLGVVAMIGMVL
jgi:hypothetical protein